jgi:cell division protein FtsW
VSRILRYDRHLLTVVALLLVLGLTMIYSSSAAVALNKKGSPAYFASHQALWAVVGVVAFAVAMRIPYERWKDRRVVLALMGLELGLLCLALAGPTINGSHRWIKLGRMTLQPSESAKFVVILFAAYLLDKRLRENREWVQTLLPLGAFAGIVSALIVIQPDLGTVVVIAVALGTMLFLAGLPWKWIVPAAATGLAALAVLIVSTPYRFQRLLTFMNPGADPKDAGFQAQQSLIAVGSGGIFGKWFGSGSQKLMFLPEPHTDFIYAMIGEELGFVGALLILGLFVYLGYRGLRAARSAPDAFGTYLATGITAWVLLQALIHVGVTLTLLPTKGLPLPLISYGGSNLVVTLAGLGVLVNISQHQE